MAENPTSPAASAVTTPKVSPEAEANTRITALQVQVTALKAEIKTIEGKLANKNPLTANALKKENDELRARNLILQKAFHGIITEGFKPRQAEDMKMQYEVLCQAAIEYFKKANVDPEIWKNIVS